jgi:hypothetical protein
LGQTTTQRQIRAQHLCLYGQPRRRRAGGRGRARCPSGFERNFLNVAKTSYTLNGFPINKKDFQAGDFWPQINRLKAADERFDCVLLDPPIYSATNKGVVRFGAKLHAADQ